MIVLYLISKRNIERSISINRVGTKEGLIIFVCEYLDYCDQLLRKPSERSAHISELVDEVNTILLRKINPVQSKRAWMAESMYSQEYFDGSPTRRFATYHTRIFKSPRRIRSNCKSLYRRRYEFRIESQTSTRTENFFLSFVL